MIVIEWLLKIILDQITVTGGGSAAPALVNLPGAYSASDPGILVNIHATLSTYIVPGPTVYSGGTTKSAGAGCTGVEAGTTTGAAIVQTNTAAVTQVVATGGSGGSGSACTQTKYGQCGGTSYTGCTSCAVSSSSSFCLISAFLLSLQVNLGKHAWHKSS